MLVLLTWRAPTFVIIIKNKNLMKNLVTKEIQTKNPFITPYNLNIQVNSVMDSKVKVFKKALSVCFKELIKDIAYVFPFLINLVTAPWRFYTIVCPGVINSHTSN